VHQKSDTKSVFSEAIPELLTDHFLHLNDGSGLSIDVIRERGYRSILGKSELEKLGFTRSVKYDSPAGSSNRLDCPPRSQKMLGNPQVPLWITEGSKKADALASRGACAISVTGVWGFKGKNQFGGITFLVDWDYVALRNRTVYLAFDSDVVTKEPVRKALEHIGEHLKRKGASVHIIQLPQLEGQDKTGIDDYLLRYSLHDAERLAGDFKPEEKEDRERYVSGFVLPDGTIGEMVVDNDERFFIVGFNGSVRKAYQHDTAKVTYSGSFIQ